MNQLLFFLILSTQWVLAKPAAQIYRMADMQETDASGYVLQTFAFVQNTLSELKLKNRTTAFEFSESMGPPPCTGPVCPLMPVSYRTRTFSAIRKTLTECGSTKYVCRNERDTLVLIDHSTRLCDDLKTHDWELKIYSTNKSIRYFQGNPQMAGDTKCERYTQNAVCMALYAPAICSHGGTKVNGSNTCYALAELKKALCEQGVDADKIPEEEIYCSMKMDAPCAIPMCAAPPVNCINEPSNELDAQGCLVNPCGVLKCTN